MRALGCIALILGIGACERQRLFAVEERLKPPYPASRVITDVIWQFDTQVRLAPGSDLWPVTWARDGHVYTSWGDGGGFGGSNSDGRVSLGFAKIEGPPEGFTAVNVWGGKNAENPAQFEGKSAGMISVGGVLYALINLQNRPWPHPDMTLAWSENLAKTWKRASWKFPGTNGAFRPETFLNFGQDNANARDNYVYVYGRNIGSAGTVHLARVAKQNIRNKAAYVYFSGLDGQGTRSGLQKSRRADPASSIIPVRIHSRLSMTAPSTAISPQQHTAMLRI
jgi:hypothetical protein